MAIEFNDDGEIMRMTEADMQRELQELKARSDALLKAEEEGKIVQPPKPKPTTSARTPNTEEKTGGNMVELRLRLEDIRLDIARLSSSTPGFATSLQAKLDKVAEQMQFIHDYLKEEAEPPKKGGILAALGWR